MWDNCHYIVLPNIRLPQLEVELLHVQHERQWFFFGRSIWRQNWKPKLAWKSWTCIISGYSSCWNTFIHPNLESRLSRLPPSCHTHPTPDTSVMPGPVLADSHTDQSVPLKTALLLWGWCGSSDTVCRPYFWFPYCQCLSLGTMDLSILKWSIDHWIPYKVTCFSMAAPFLFPEISLDLSTHGSSCICIDCIFNETQVVTLLLSALSCLDQPSPTRFFWKSCCWGLWDPWDSRGVTLHFKRLGCHIMYTCKELV